MKTRVFQTRFYDDEYIVDTDLYSQHLYLYLLTCSYINISGIFQLPDRKIMFEAKFDKLQDGETILQSAKEALSKAGKVHFKDGWVYVVNALKNNNYIKSSDNMKAYMREVERMPQEVLDYFGYSTVYTSVCSTQNTEYRKENKENRKENTEKVEEIKAKIRNSFKMPK